MPFADKFNAFGILVIHFRPLIWKKRTRLAIASLVLLGIVKLAGTHPRNMIQSMGRDVSFQLAGALTFTKPLAALLYLANLHHDSLLS